MISKELEPSILLGCQYLHAPIPGLKDAQTAKVGYHLIGTPEQYRLKVYGNEWKGKVSPEDFIGEHDAWDIRETYNRLWHGVKFYAHSQIRIAGGNLSAVRMLKPDRIISTIPAMNLCESPFAKHEFYRHLIYASGASRPQDGLGANQVMCVGDESTDWYRSSNVFGYRTVEWPAGRSISRPEGTVRVYKPLSTDCDCHPDVIRVGRYGEWDKSVLVHQVYDKVVKALS
jgi:hypothetical protein